jgi:hypothetical protein
MIVKQIIRILTAGGAEAAYLGLVAYFVYLTWNASGGAPPLSEVQTGAAAALAVALGGGYALALGITPQGLQFREGKPRLAWLLKTILAIGIVGYFGAGVACCVTYAFNESVTPGILKALSAGFGGYVVAYLAQAYKDAFGNDSGGRHDSKRTVKGPEDVMHKVGGGGHLEGEGSEPPPVEPDPEPRG